MRLVWGFGTASLVLGLSASGCSSSDDGASGDAGIPFEELPGELMTATCKLLENCGAELSRLYLPNEECTTLQERAFLDSDFPALAAAVEQGRVVYHPTAARACLDAIANGQCDVLVGGLPEICEEAIEGATPLGGECTVDAECGSTRYCNASATCPGACAERGGEGASCASDEACGRGLICGPGGACTSPLPRGSACEDGGAPCAAGSFCFGSGPGAPGRCEDASTLFTTNEGQSCDISNGPLCNPELVCVPSSGSAGSCERPSKLGESCVVAFPDGCGSDGYCQIGGDGSGTCVELPAAGEPCAQVLGPQCQPFARCVSGTCRNLQRLGGNCEDDTMCYSGNCDGNVCKSTDACSR